jgi:ankyrin repeat protein
MIQNYKGETPIHLAIRSKNLELLSVFESRKKKVILVKDIYGENPLFYAARTSSSEIFNWFYMPESGSQSDYFKARGD